MTVFQRGAQSWEWRVHTGDHVHVCGFEISQMAARYAGYSTLFQMLGSVWL
jgi:hypothetical protein